MKRRNKILLGCLAVSMIVSSSRSAQGICTSTDYVISGDTTQSISLSCMDTVHITSSGSITVSGDTSNTALIKISGGQIVHNTILNEGVLSITGAVNNEVYGIHLSATTDKPITNSGTINATNNLFGVGIEVSVIYGNDSAITNSGIINATTNNYAGIGILIGINDSNITNSGTINATNNPFGTGMSIGDNYGTITNSGTITADTALNVSGSDGLVLNTGTINTSTITVRNIPFINSGKIYLHKGAVASQIDKFIQSTSGMLSIDASISADGTSATNPTINAATSASLADKSTINVNIIGNNAEKFFLDNNGTLNNVINSGNIDANVTKLNITDNSPILKFEAYLNDTNTSLSLLAVKDTNIAPANSPTVATSTSMVNLEILDSFSSIVQNRQGTMRGLGSGDIIFSDKYVWVKPFGAYSKQNNKGGKNGFDATTYGFAFGSDGEYEPGKRAGMAFFFSNTDVNVNDLIQNNTISAFTFIAYGSQPIIDDKSILYYQAGFGWQNNDSSRYVNTVGQAAKADYTSSSFFIQAKATKDYKINNKLTMIPAIQGVYRYFKTPSYSEVGAGAYNLNVNSSNTEQALLGVLTDLKYKIDKNTKFFTHIGLMYDFNSDAQTINASFQDSPDIPFTTLGIKNSAFGYEVGFGISKQLKKSLVLDVKYNLSGRGNDYINHAVSAKFKWKF
ncbi:MAG: autotransporter domain-containing protein [Sulfurospirillaceae bacterium]|nr:autotransporter domain-containing protein [Sulfurospirillaceae bacterium]